MFEIQVSLFAGCIPNNIMGGGSRGKWKQGMEMANVIIWSLFATAGGVFMEMHSEGGGSGDVSEGGGYGSGSWGGGYGYVLRLTGYVQLAGVACWLMILPLTYRNDRAWVMLGERL